MTAWRRLVAPPPWRACAVLAGTAVVVGVGACADFEGSVDPAFGLPDVVVERPTLARDIQPILDKRCAFGGCHSDATRQAALSLTPSEAFGALVGRPSTLRPAQVRVVPGDTARSWLLVMLGADETRRGGFSRMPLAAAPLTPNQLATVANWIAAGAPQ